MDLSDVFKLQLLSVVHVFPTTAKALKRNEFMPRKTLVHCNPRVYTAHQHKTKGVASTFVQIVTTHAIEGVISRLVLKTIYCPSFFRQEGKLIMSAIKEKAVVSCIVSHV